MTDEAIKPALTPEEWKGERENASVIGGVLRHAKTTRKVNDDLFVVEVDGNPVRNLTARKGGAEIDSDECRALAALCLYGQPFGFTREDVALIDSEIRGATTLVQYAEEQRQKGHSPAADRAASDGRDRIRVLQSLRSRLAALLPPEETR